MEETNKISLKCPKCGREFHCKAPSATGKFSVLCPDPDCKAQIGFSFKTDESASHTAGPKVKLGLLDDGSYRFKCENKSCGKSVLVPNNILKPGHNKAVCPNCKTPHEFEIEPREEDLLRCQASDCDGILKKPDGGDGVYNQGCPKCNKVYSILIHNHKVEKVTMKTSVAFTSIKQVPMKLVSGILFAKKEHQLSKGTHYIGRQDHLNASDFSIKDKYASSRSVRIDVNENGGKLIYKMTVERALNPVYHNNSELTVGDIVYLTYGDTIMLGKTLIKVQKTKT